MKKIDSPLSIKILYWFSVFSYWMITVISALVLFVNIFLLTDLYNGDMQLRIKMPVPIDVHEYGSIHIDGSVYQVQIEEAFGSLYIVDTPVSIIKTAARFLLIALIIGYYIVRKFKVFITNLKNGFLFEIQNINNLKHMAYGILALWLFVQIYLRILYYYLVEEMTFETITISNNIIPVDLIGLALILWALAHVFIKGLEMKNEQELTI